MRPAASKAPTSPTAAAATCTTWAASTSRSSVAGKCSDNFLINGGGPQHQRVVLGSQPAAAELLPVRLRHRAADWLLQWHDADRQQPAPLDLARSPALGINATYAGTGAPVSLNQSVIQQGWWYIQKRCRTSTMSFASASEIFDGNTAHRRASTSPITPTTTTGRSATNADDQHAQCHPDRAELSVLARARRASHVYNLTSPQGFVK